MICSTSARATPNRCAYPAYPRHALVQYPTRVGIKTKTLHNFIVIYHSHLPSFPASLLPPHPPVEELFVVCSWLEGLNDTEWSQHHSIILRKVVEDEPALYLKDIQRKLRDKYFCEFKPC